MKLKLTVEFIDAEGNYRKQSGTYPYLSALARLECAAKLPNFVDFHMEAA